MQVLSQEIFPLPPRGRLSSACEARMITGRATHARPGRCPGRIKRWRVRLLYQPDSAVLGPSILNARLAERRLAQLGRPHRRALPWRHDRLVRAGRLAHRHRTGLVPLECVRRSLGDRTLRVPGRRGTAGDRQAHARIRAGVARRGRVVRSDGPGGHARGVARVRNPARGQSPLSGSAGHRVRAMDSRFASAESHRGDPRRGLRQLRRAARRRTRGLHVDRLSGAVRGTQPACVRLRHVLRAGAPSRHGARAGYRPACSVRARDAGAGNPTRHAVRFPHVPSGVPGGHAREPRH